MNNDETILDESQITQIMKRCPNCGGNPTFDITSGNLVCGHCNFTQEIEADDRVQRRQLTDDIKRTKTNWTEGQVFQCGTCGAKEVLTNQSITQRCTFCGNNTIISKNELSGVKPDSVIPFRIDINSARELFSKWIKSRFFAPSSFKRYDIRECMSPLYCPSWAFSSNVLANYDGVLGRSQTFQTRNSQGQIVTQTRTVHFNARGSMNVNYTDHLVQSSSRISPALFRQLQPFDLRQLKVYRTEFLSGIATEHYSREIEQCFEEFSNFIRTDLRRRIIRKHNADSARRLDINLNFTTREFNYILLPLYIANYRYQQKTFNFYVNGVNGKIVGKYPKSKTKIFFLLLGLGASLAAFVGAMYWFIIR